MFADQDVQESVINGSLRSVSPNLFTMRRSQNLAVILTLSVGVRVEDVGVYTCILINTENNNTVVQNETIQVAVLLPEGPGSSVFIRLSIVEQSIIDRVISMQPSIMAFEFLVSNNIIIN